MATKRKYVRKEVADGQEKKEARSIYELLGKGVNTVYKTHDIVEYEAEIRGMALVDLQAHAIKIGIKPSNDRNAVIRKLLAEFRIAMSSYIGAKENSDKQENNQLSKEKREAILKLLAPGR